MMTLLAGVAVGQLLQSLERPLRWLDHTTELLADQRRERVRRVIRLDIAVNAEEFGQLAATPGLLQAIARARIQKQLGVVKHCTRCGAVRDSAAV